MRRRTECLVQKRQAPEVDEQNGAMVPNTMQIQFENNRHRSEEVRSEIESARQNSRGGGPSKECEGVLTG